MEVPRPGIESSLKLQQQQILNPLGQGLNQHLHRDSARSLNYCAAARTPGFYDFKEFCFFFFLKKLFLKLYLGKPTSRDHKGVR